MSNTKNLNENPILVDEFYDSCWIDEEMKLPFTQREVLETYLNTYDVISHCYYGERQQYLQIVYKEKGK